MVELKVQLEDIDYSGIAAIALPIAKKKLAERNSFLAKLAETYVPESALGTALDKCLNFLSPEQKDEIALSLINQYGDKIIAILQQAASNHGVNMTIKGISAESKN